MFVQVGTLDVDIGEGIDGGVRHEAVGDGSQSDLYIFVEGLVRTVGVGPL